MTSGFFTGDVLRGLAARVLLFLSLALLPIGLIAIVQTRQITDQSKANAELSLLAVTERISAAEERVLQEAFGAAEALASIVRLRHHSPEECGAFLKEYKEASGLYAMVGFVEADGVMRCSSVPGETDFSDAETFQHAVAARARFADARHGDEEGKRSSTLVTTPVFEGETLIGLMMISVPVATFDEIDEPDLPLKPLALLTFNKFGKVLTSEKAFEEVREEVPADVSLAAFSGKRTSVFRSINKMGEYRAYAVLPLVPDAVYAMSVWPSDTPFLRSNISSRLSALLPIIMWVASLIVAFMALNRLAITHIRKLGRQMRRFAFNRTLPRDTLSPSVPAELVEMERAFIDMAESIMRDEAQQEDSLREKNILLKEVHHRVKNNLQLISSIMNMQIRQAGSDDSRAVLQRLQERILSLATVHESLYQNDSRVRVDASRLLHDTVNQLLKVGLQPDSNIKVTQHYDSVTLDPDDAAPLTLLVSEAVTNALKYVSAEDGAHASITVNLRYDGEGHANLTVENTATSKQVASGTGLGSKLITAFTRQLNGQDRVSHENGIYRFEITFPVPEKAKPVIDF